jgi:hypothetical protein
MVYIPGQSLATIADLVPGVRKALQNRDEVTPQVAAPWIQKSLKEITRIVPFMELQSTGPLQFLTVNQYSYPVAFFLNPGDDYGEHSSLSIFVDYPNNTIAYPLNYQTPRAIEPLLHIPGGLPSKWTRYGTQILVGPQPNQTYNIFMRYQRKHPFNDANLPTSPVLIDETWFDIIEYAAAERGAIELRWNDQAKFLHDILFGDPEFQTSDGKKGRPGLIFARKLQMEQDEGQNVRQVIVTVPRYT